MRHRILYVLTSHNIDNYTAQSERELKKQSQRKALYIPHHHNESTLHHFWFQTMDQVVCGAPSVKKKSSQEKDKKGR